MKRRKHLRNVALFILMMFTLFIVWECYEVAVGNLEKSTYTKFQDRMSMDWDSFDSEYLKKAAMIKGNGKSVEEKADIIIVTLNRVLNEKYPKDIKSVVEEVADEEGMDLDEIEPDSEAEEALRLVMIERYDNTKGRLNYE